MNRKSFITKTFKTNKNLLHTGFLLFILIISLAGCKTLPETEELPEEPAAPIEKPEAVIISRKLIENGKLNAFQLTDFFMENNPEAKYEDILNIAYFYKDEADAENINSDVAFAQMCLETGFLRFGGLVQPEWHNYCGLGAMGPENPGERFDTEQEGVRAHIQHLQAYATTEDIKLNKILIDPRYSWVHKTKYVEDIWGLAGTWATDPDYGTKINAILTRMEEMWLPNN